MSTYHNKQETVAEQKDRHELLARNLRPVHYEMFTHILYKDTGLRSGLSEEVISGLKSIVSIYEAMPRDQRLA